MKFLYLKIVLSFKFILLFHIFCYIYFFLENKKFSFSVLDYLSITLCIFFRYILIILTIIYIPIVLLFFTLSLIFLDKVELGFSKRYLDESRFSLLLYLLFFKLPLAASKFLVYTLLRVSLESGKKKRVRISFKSFLFNILFVNLFGSPR